MAIVAPRHNPPMSPPISASVDVIAYALWPTPTPAGASGDTDPWQAALRSVQQQPVMQQLARLQAVTWGDLPHERQCSSHEWAHAQALGWRWDTGLLPFAALAAQQRQLSCPPEHGWAFIDLVQADFNQGQVLYSLPASLSDSESDGFLHAMRPYFEEDGIELFALSPGRYLAHGACLKQLPSTSLSLVLQEGVHALADPQPLVAQSPAQRLLRRLQNEMQMLLYTHPLNEHRQPAINSFWLSATGDLPDSAGADVRLHLALEPSFLAASPQAWAAQWLALAETVIWPALTQGGDVVLCGPQRCVQLIKPTPSWLSAITHRFHTPQLVRVLS